MKKSKALDIHAAVSILSQNRKDKISAGLEELKKIQAAYLKAKTAKSKLLIGSILCDIRAALTGENTAAAPQTEVGRLYGAYVKEHIGKIGVCSRRAAYDYMKAYEVATVECGIPEAYVKALAKEQDFLSVAVSGDKPFGVRYTGHAEKFFAAMQENGDSGAENFVAGVLAAPEKEKEEVDPYMNLHNKIVAGLQGIMKAEKRDRTDCLLATRYLQDVMSTVLLALEHSKGETVEFAAAALNLEEGYLRFVDRDATDSMREQMNKLQAKKEAAEKRKQAAADKKAAAEKRKADAAAKKLSAAEIKANKIAKRAKDEADKAAAADQAKADKAARDAVAREAETTETTSHGFYLRLVKTDALGTPWHMFRAGCDTPYNFFSSKQDGLLAVNEAEKSTAADEAGEELAACA